MSIMSRWKSIWGIREQAKRNWKEDLIQN